MRQLYTLIANALLVSAASAQVNMNFEAPITHPNTNFPEIGFTAGWGQGRFTVETNNPGQGLQSCKMATVHNPALATFSNSSSDTLAGFITQTIKGLIQQPANLTINFKYKYTAVNGDKGAFLVHVYDTLQAGPSDDLLLFRGTKTINPATIWTTETVTLTAVPNTTGTATQLFIFANSSVKSNFTGATLPAPSPGSTLWLDNILLFTPLGINEKNTLSATVYPNPTSDKLNFTLEGSEAVSISISGLDGKQVLSNQANGMSGSIDISFLNAGMYFYEIVTITGETAKSTFVKN